MKRPFVVVVLLALVLVMIVAWSRPSDPVAELRRFDSPLESVERIARPDLGEGVEIWALAAASGERDTAIWRPSRHPAPGTWTIVMLGGLGPGARAGLLVPEELPLNVLALDWHWQGPRAPRGMQFVTHAFGFRRLVLSAPLALARTVAAAARAPEVDTSRIALLGVSLGVPPSVSALRFAPEADAVVLLHGGAAINELMARSLEREHVPPSIARVAGNIGASFIAPIEPLRHADALRDVPALLINSTTDDIVPEAAARKLHALFPHRESRWGEGPHIRKFRTALIDSLSREMLVWLETGPHRVASR
jgi:pimeloyl-ACP methyl ester carboxylesterase